MKATNFGHSNSGHRARCRTRILLGVVAPLLLSDPLLAQNGAFVRHEVRIEVSGRAPCASDKVTTEQTFTSNAVSIPLAGDGLSCATRASLNGASISLNYPNETPPLASRDFFGGVTVSSPMAFRIEAAGTWNLEPERAQSTWFPSIYEARAEGGPTGGLAGADVDCPDDDTSTEISESGGSIPVDFSTECTATSFFEHSDEQEGLVAIGYQVEIFLRSKADARRLIRAYLRVTSVYDFGEAGDGDFIELRALDPAPGTSLEAYSNQGFTAELTTDLQTESAGTAFLEILDGAEDLVDLHSLTVLRSDGRKTGQITVPPFLIEKPVRQLKIRAYLDSNLSGATLAETIVSSYPVTPPQDRLAVTACDPSPQVSLAVGSQAVFRCTASFAVKTVAEAVLVLRVADGAGNLLGSGEGLATAVVAESPEERAQQLSQAITIPETDRILTWVELIGPGDQLLFQSEPIEYGVADGEPGVVVVQNVTEDVEFKLEGGEWMLLVGGMTLGEGAEISTGPDSEVSLLFPDGSVMVVHELTQVGVGYLLSKPSSLQAEMQLRIGKVAARVNPAKKVATDLSVKSPIATMSVRGTAFDMEHREVPEPMSAITVEESVVDVIPENLLLDPFVLFAGESAIVYEDRVVFVGSAGTDWREEVFGADARNPEIAAPNANPDHDLSPNILERLSGGDPTRHDSASLPRVSADPAAAFPITFQYVIDERMTDLRAVIQTSLDGIAWTDGMALTPLGAGAGYAREDGGETVFISDSQSGMLWTVTVGVTPTAGQPTKLVRLAVWSRVPAPVDEGTWETLFLEDFEQALGARGWQVLTGANGFGPFPTVDLDPAAGISGQGLRCSADARSGSDAEGDTYFITLTSPTIAGPLADTDLSNLRLLGEARDADPANTHRYRIESSTNANFSTVTGRVQFVPNGSPEFTSIGGLLSEGAPIGDYNPSDPFHRIVISINHNNWGFDLNSGDWDDLRLEVRTNP